MDHLEEIRNRISIESLVGEYTQLKKAGKNYKALCPFHNEKTPSFIISPDKGIAYCFGCQQGGDIFKFTQLVERIEFPEAVKLLADKAGVKLPEFSTGRKKNLTVQNINEVAAIFFKEQLSRNPNSFQYLINRGINQETIDKFQIGLAPDSFEKTTNFLLEQGFNHKEIIDSGLAVSKNLTDLKIYDRFRNRIMFPIQNTQGQIIAFGGRALDNNDQAKYLNSPETDLYNKSYAIFGLAQAKESIRKQDQVIIVEGYMDVIASHQAGITNVVAASGTALTIQQINLLKRFTSNFYLCFDNDSAGFEATKRACELTIGAEINTQIITLNQVKDPDECIKKNPDDWKKAIKAALPFLDFYLKRLIQENDLKTISGKKELGHKLLPFIQKIPNQIEKNLYLKNLSEVLDLDIQILQIELKRLKKDPVIDHKNKDYFLQSKENYTLEDYLFGLICHYPEYAHLIIENLKTNLIIDPELKKIYNYIETIYNHQGDIVFSELFKNNAETAETIEYYQILQLFIEEKYYNFGRDAIEQEVGKITKSLNNKNYLKIKTKLINDMKKNQDNPEYLSNLLNQYNDILNFKIS